MFTKLFSSITTSSIWNEDNNTRIVWITMLAMANKNGYVSASVGGLAHEARVTREDCERALEVLMSEDKDSRSKEFEGRRVEVADGGFQLLNHAKYRAMRSEEERKEYMRSYMVEYRRTKNVNNVVNNVSECKPPLAQAEADKIREDKKEEDSPNGSSVALKLPIESKEVVIPENLLTDEFVQWWNSWLVYRKKKKKSGDWRLLFRMQLETLEKMVVSQAVHSLKTAIAKGWLDPYESKNKVNSQGKIRSSSEYNEALKEKGLI